MRYPNPDVTSPTTGQARTPLPALIAFAAAAVAAQVEDDGVHAVVLHRLPHLLPQ